MGASLPWQTCIKPGIISSRPRRAWSALATAIQFCLIAVLAFAIVALDILKKWLLKFVNF
jgi:hypothetical protein